MTSVLVDGSQTKQDLSRLLQDINQIVSNSVQNAVRAGVENAKSTTTFKDRGGSGGFLNSGGFAKSTGLRKNIFGMSYSNRSAVGGKLVADTPYARWVEEGTQPHEIRARRAKALAFVLNGQRVFRRSVYHPGTAPTYFMRTALAHSIEVLQFSLESQLNSAFLR